MLIKNIFNLILLSLILTTIFITIVSYIVFRIRQLSGTNVRKALHHLEGVYFKRYQPFLEKENQEFLLKHEKDDDSKLNLKVKFSVIFVLLFFVISFLLVLENHFNYRTELLRKADSAETYRKLIKEGLFKKYDFVSKTEISPLKQTLTPSQKIQAQMLLEAMVDREFVIYKGSQAWENFLTGFKSRTKTAWDLKNESGQIVLIVPNIENLNSSEVESLISYSKGGGALIFSGSPKIKGLRDFLGLHEVEKVKTKINIYSQLYTDNFIEYNGGIDPRYEEEASFIDSEGHPILYRWVNSRILWLQNPPERSKGESLGFNQLPSLLLINHLLSGFTLTPSLSGKENLSFIPIFKVSDLTNVDYFNSFFKKYPKITLISEKNLAPEGLETRGYAFTISGDDLSVKNYSEKYRFDMIEQARFDLEEFTHRGVSGISLERTDPTAELLSSALQNHLSYFFPFEIKRNYPWPILLNDEVLSYAGIDLSDEEFLASKSYVTLDECLDAFSKRLAGYAKKQKTFSLLFHTELYDSEFNRRFLSAVFEKMLAEKELVSVEDFNRRQRYFMNVSYQLMQKGQELVFRTLNRNEKSERISFFIKSSLPMEGPGLLAKEGGYVLTLEALPLGESFRILKVKSSR